MHNSETTKSKLVKTAAGGFLAGVALIGVGSPKAFAETTGPESPVATTSAAPTSTETAPEPTETTSVSPSPVETTIDDNGMTETAEPTPSQTTIDDNGMTETPTPSATESTPFDDGDGNMTPPATSGPSGNNHNAQNHATHAPELAATGAAESLAIEGALGGAAVIGGAALLAANRRRPEH